MKLDCVVSPEVNQRLAVEALERAAMTLHRTRMSLTLQTPHSVERQRLITLLAETEAQTRAALTELTR
jgi:hypothetical protein